MSIDLQLELHGSAYPRLYESILDDDDSDRVNDRLNDVIAGPSPPVNYSPFAVPNLHYAVQEVASRAQLGEDKENG